MGHPQNSDEQSYVYNCTPSDKAKSAVEELHTDVTWVATVHVHTLAIYSSHKVLYITGLAHYLS